MTYKCKHCKDTRLVGLVRTPKHIRPYRDIPCSFCANDIRGFIEHFEWHITRIIENWTRNKLPNSLRIELGDKLDGI